MSQYWAALVDSADCVSEIQKRIEDYRAGLTESGRAQRMTRAWNANYGLSPDGNKTTSALTPAGEEGQILNLAVNHFAALATQAVVLTTSARPAFKAIATNSDSTSLAQTHLADGLNSYYERDLGLAEKEVQVVRNAVLLSSGFLSIGWNPSLGKEYAVGEDGKALREGDLEFAVHTPFDVAFDETSQDFDALKWCCIRKRESRWELAATYPHLADEIIRHGDTVGMGGQTEFATTRTRQQAESDTVWVWEFRHKPTAALPDGRLIRFLSADCVLFDTVERNELGEVVSHGYPYDDLALYGMVAEDKAGTMEGYTPFFDLTSLQEVVDMVASAAATNINVGAVNNLWTPPTSNLSPIDLSGGMKWLRSETKPEVVNLAKVSGDAMQFAAECIRWMRQRVALNDVVMGEPSNGMPAQAMALLHAQAIQFHSKLQQNYQRMVERVRTGMLRVLKRYANTQRVALITGKSSEWALREFKAQDLEGVDRFVVEAVNPASKTFAMRLQMAHDFLERGLITPEQYLQILDTGRLEVATEARQANQVRLQKEKELLQKGIGLPPVDASGEFIADGQQHLRPLISDPHWADIPEYLAVLSSPEARDNPQLVKAVTEAVQYKVDLWRQQDPVFQQVLGGGPPAPPMAGALGGMPRPPPLPSGDTKDAGAGQSQSPLTGLQQSSPGINLPKMPQPPKNPITGEQQPPEPLVS